MILTDSDIKSAMRAGNIIISDYTPQRLGSNSYDLRLSEDLAIYTSTELDCAQEMPVKRFKIPPEGLVLLPGELYLGSTAEHTTTRQHVPFIEGKSSIGRLGISIHVTAGVGDVGFAGHWTLEITVVKPIRVYAYMPIAQIFFFLTAGICSIPYNRKSDAKYANQPGIPVPSQMHKNFTAVQPVVRIDNGVSF